MRNLVGMTMFRCRLLCLAVALCACGPAPAGAGRTVAIGGGEAEEKMNEAELQQAVQRIASGFLSSIGQAGAEAFTQSRPEVRKALLRRVLLYQSSILDIATGPFPETNMLDMIAFAELSGDALRRYWIPEVFGEPARSLNEPFVRLRDEAWQLASRLLGPAQREQLAALIRAWQEEHPEEVNVAGVRLADFASVAGKISAKREKEIGGLLSSAKGAVRAANQAVLLGERAMYLAQREPFVLREQVRLGALEVVGDSVASAREAAREAAHEAENMLEQSQKLRPLLHDTAATLDNARLAATEAQALSVQMLPLLQGAREVIEGDRLHETLTTSDRLTDRTLEIVTRLQAMQPGARETLAEVQATADSLLRRMILYLVGAGIVLIALFWVGYYVVRRLTARF